MINMYCTYSEDRKKSREENNETLNGVREESIKQVNVTKISPSLGAFLCTVIIVVSQYLCEQVQSALEGVCVMAVDP